MCKVSAKQHMFAKLMLFYFIQLDFPMVLDLYKTHNRKFVPHSVYKHRPIMK